MTVTYALCEMDLPTARAWLAFVGIGGATGKRTAPLGKAEALAIAERLTPIEHRNVGVALAIVQAAVAAECEAAEIEACPRCRQHAQRHTPDHTKEGPN